MANISPFSPVPRRRNFVETESTPNLAPLPGYLAGKGGLPHWQVMELFDRSDDADKANKTVRDLQPESDAEFPRREGPLPAWFPAQVFDSRGEPFPLPLGRTIAWDEVFYNDSDTYVSAQERTSRDPVTGDNDFLKSAVHLTAPNGFMLASTNDDGQERYFWMPGTMAYAAYITSVEGTPPAHSYSIETADRSFKGSGLVPHDRWDGINYTARQVGDQVLLLVFGLFNEPSTGACCIGGVCFDGLTAADCAAAGGTFLGPGTGCNGPECEDAGGGDFEPWKLIAYETPVFAMCPPAPASASGLESFVGL